jgi:hypothetical protein
MFSLEFGVDVNIGQSLRTPRVLKFPQELFALQFCFPSKSTLSENGDRLLGRDLAALLPRMHRIILGVRHVALVLPAPDNTRGVAHPLGGAARDFASRNHPSLYNRESDFRGVLSIRSSRDLDSWGF